MSVSYKVMKTADGDAAVVYRAECGCGDPDDDLILEVEAREEGVYLVFSGTYSAASHDDNWFVRAYRRVKMALLMLFSGRLETHKEFVMVGRRHIREFAGVLEEATERVDRAYE